MSIFTLSFWLRASLVPFWLAHGALCEMGALQMRLTYRRNP